MKRFLILGVLVTAGAAKSLLGQQAQPSAAPAVPRHHPAGGNETAPVPQRPLQPSPVLRTRPPAYGSFSGVGQVAGQAQLPRYWTRNADVNAMAAYRRHYQPRTGREGDINSARPHQTPSASSNVTGVPSGASPRSRWSGTAADWNGTNNTTARTGDWRNRNNGDHNRGNWNGNANDAWRRYHYDHHHRDWWRSHYNTIILINGGYYYWDAGWWYPAWGYDTNYSYYPYDGPIYGYNDLPPDQAVADVQEALREEGYYSGDVDGQLGAMTREAIAAWQRDHGLAITSVIDDPTIQSLGL